MGAHKKSSPGEPGDDDQRVIRYEPAFRRSRTLPSISARPAGTAGYHLMLSMAAFGKLSANWSFSLPCISLSAPFEAVKLPAAAATFAAISGRMLKLIHLQAASSARPLAGIAKVSTQPK